jgi:protein involved in polysaccharide export with SLBB domain
MKQFLTKKLPVLTLLVFMNFYTNAQVTNAQLALIKTELSKKGLTEAEATAGLLENGIDINALSTEELIAKQEQITSVLDKMAASKNKAVEVNAPETSEKVITTENKTDQPIIIEKETIIEEKIIEVQKPVEVPVVVNAPNTIYGHHLFTDRTFELVGTTDGSTAPETYVLGAGDQLRVTIFGISQADILLTINESGFVAPSGMGQIYVKGLSLKEARKVIRNRFSTTYRFQSDEFAVTLQQARMLTVNVFGESKKGGSFQLSALNSALNAIVAAGGPTELGSIRMIELIRGETKKKIDIYAFLSNPSMRFQYDLQHNDILFIPVAQKIVRIEGAVKRPMNYELIGKEGLKEALTFAGGVNYNTSVELVQIERHNGEKVALLEYKLADVLSGVLKIELLDGDLIRLKTVNKPLDRFVEINGAVFYPGRYEWKENMLLTQLLEKAQVTPQAFDGLYVLEKTLLDGTSKLLKLSKTEMAAYVLDKKDKVTIYDKALYTDQQEIEVSGSVRLPFKKMLTFGDNITVINALELAGGLKATATEIAYILRKNALQQGKTEFIPLNAKNPGAILLKAGDHLRVFDKDEYLNLAQIEVSGAVRAPFKKELAFGDTLSLVNAIEFAQGLLPTTADIAYVKRKNLFVPNDYEYFKVNLKQPANFVLQAGDILMVYDKSIYSYESTVSIAGSVNNPTAMPFSDQLTLPDLFLMAGGKKESADLNRVDVFRLKYTKNRGSGFEKITLSLDTLYNVLTKKSTFELLPYDQVVIRDKVLYSKNNSVQVNGEVRFPGNYQMPASVYRLSDLIKDAGGLNVLANHDFGKLYRSENQVGPIGINLKKALRRKKSSKFNPILLKGDLVTIYKNENTFSIRMLGTNYPEINNEGKGIKHFVYQGKRSAKWYIKNFAGGFDEKANKNSVTVSYQNGQVASTSHFLGMFRNYPSLKNGGTINIELTPEKVKGEKKEVDFDAIFTRSFQAMSSLLTITLLINQLSK